MYCRDPPPPSRSATPPVPAARAGDPGADVEELAQALLIREIPDRPGQERAVGPDVEPDGGPGPEHLLGGFPVDGEVVLAAEPVVVDPGRMRDAGVDVPECRVVRRDDTLVPRACQGWAHSRAIDPRVTLGPPARTGHRRSAPRNGPAPLARGGQRGQGVPPRPARARVTGASPSAALRPGDH